MSRFLSLTRRFAGVGLLQDICAFAAMAVFVAVAVYGSAGMAMLVLAWRAVQ